MEYRSPVCKARICRKSPLMFQHPSFILARRNNRHHFRVSSRVMPMPPGYTKVFGFAPTWCTKKIPRKKLRGIFYCCFPEKQELGAPSGTRTARAPRPRTAGQKQSCGLFLGRGCFTFYAPHDAKAAIKMFAQKGNSSIDEFPFCS